MHPYCHQTLQQILLEPMDKDAVHLIQSTFPEIEVTMFDKPNLYFGGVHVGLDKGVEWALVMHVDRVVVSYFNKKKLNIIYIIRSYLLSYNLRKILHFFLPFLYQTSNHEDLQSNV